MLTWELKIVGIAGFLSRSSTVVAVDLLNTAQGFVRESTGKSSTNHIASICQGRNLLALTTLQTPVKPVQKQSCEPQPTSKECPARHNLPSRDDGQ